MCLLDAGRKGVRDLRSKLPERNKLPRRKSLKRHRDIQQLLMYGRRLSANGFHLKWLPAEDFRYVLIVTKKHGNAVQRNRIKRLFREAIRLNQQYLAQPCWVAVFPSVSNLKPDFKIINEEISRIFRTLFDRYS